MSKIGLHSDAVSKQKCVKLKFEHFEVIFLLWEKTGYLSG